MSSSSRPRKAFLHPIHLDSHSTHPSTPSNVPDAPQDPSNAPRLISWSELAQHNTRESLWVLIDGEVYNATEIIDTHPGGVAPLVRQGGKDATKAFKPIHPPGTLAMLPEGAHIGSIDPSTIPKELTAPSAEDIWIAEARAKLPPPNAVLNLVEMEELAKQVLTKTAWGYYRSDGDDGNTFSENRNAFKRFWFRPRVLNKISRVSTQNIMLGLPSTLPIFIAPAALARLGHPDGEMNLARAAGSEGILHAISSNASCSISEIASVLTPTQPLIFQLYVNRDRNATVEHLRKVGEAIAPGAKNGAFRALMVTVDAAVSGKRELDQRSYVEGASSGAATFGKKEDSGAGVGSTISGYQDPDVCWDDIPWLRKHWNLPLMLKGIQCVEDAEKAYDQYKVQGIVLSNHGGRELDYSPAPITVLHELRQRRPDILDDPKFEVYIDGGITRGTDVLKALCLGARGVGLGRAFLYANALWGEEGCRRVVQIMREEIVAGMQLMGVTSLDQLRPELVKFHGETNSDVGPRSRL